MKLLDFQRLAAAAASVLIVLPQLALAAAPETRTVDVALQRAPHTGASVLAGQLLNAEGAPQANQQVAVYTNHQVVAKSQTNEQGVFAVQHLTPGVYTVQAGEAIGNYRVWDAQVAPPAAQPAVLMVNGPVARGQMGGRILNAMGNPWVLGGIVAAAIAIPIALDDDDAS